MDSHFDKYRQELDKENLTSFKDLENLIRPLIRTATEIEVSKPSKPKANTQLLSHFGGQPYFEEGEEWPKTKKGKNLNFIFQVYNNGEINLPGNIKLVQFFYDWDEFPWETENDGWLVKTYTTLNTSQIIEHAQPAELETTKFCEITFKPVQSLPDWEGIGTYSKNASNLSCVLDEDEPGIITKRQ